MDFSAAALLSHSPHLRFDHLDLTPQGISGQATLTAPTADCPHCGCPSQSTHSRYTRQLRDLPCLGRTVRLRLTVRRFRCRNRQCRRAVFCERFPGVLQAHARTAQPLTQAQRLLGFALGGEAGARLAVRLAMPTSPDTLLRRVQQTPEELRPAPRVVGVDDFAFRKGQIYGTIIMDLERGEVLDLLPGRDGEALKRWLQAHPTVEVISRDRWEAYAKAAAEGAPQAQQVADRWHLLKNLRETLERLFERHFAAIKDVLTLPATAEDEQIAASASEEPAALRCKILFPQETSLDGATVPTEVPESTGEASHCSAGVPASTIPSAVQCVRQAKRQRRVERYERVHRLHGEGHSIRQIAKEVGLSRQVVRRYLRAEQFPERQPSRLRPKQLDRFRQFIDQRIEMGCDNAAELYRQLAAQGCRASYATVSRYLGRRLREAGQSRRARGLTAAAAATAKIPTPRQLSFEFLRRPERRGKEVQARHDRLGDLDEALTGSLELAEKFAALLRKQSALSLAEWLTQAEQCSSVELRNFASGLRDDEAAVAAAIQEPWSTGPVEGAINRLKHIKRQMYGRAGLALLRARVCQAS